MVHGEEGKGRVPLPKYDVNFAKFSTAFTFFLQICDRLPALGFIKLGTEIVKEYQPVPCIVHITAMPARDRIDTGAIYRM